MAKKELKTKTVEDKRSGLSRSWWRHRDQQR